MNVSEELVEALLADFEQHGAATIAKVRAEEPHVFLKLMAATMPKQLAITGSGTHENDREVVLGALVALDLGVRG